MDIINIKRNSTLTILCLFLLAFTAVFFATAIIPVSSTAYADSMSVTVGEITCDKLNTELMTYSEEPYNAASGNFGTNIIIRFNLVGGKFYYFGTSVDGGEELVDSNDKTAVKGNSAVYRVKTSGNVKVTLYLTDDINTVSDSVTVKSDIDKPDSFGTVNAMTNWLGGSSSKEFAVSADLSGFSDGLSGKSDVYYSFKYDNGTVLYPITKAEGSLITFKITDNGVLTVYYTDRAGNFATDEHSFDKFDSVAPQAPKIIVTPVSDLTEGNGYSSKYKVVINYAADSGSGLKSDLYYTCNEVQSLYNGEFFLVDEIDYSIWAYAVDNAGNSSERTTVTLSKDVIDASEPLIYSEKQYSVNLMEVPSFTLKVVVNDNKSKVKEVYATVDGNKLLFEAGEAGTYTLKFDAFNRSGLTVYAADNAGNIAFTNYPLSYFGDKTFSEKIKGYQDRYLNSDFNLYNASIKKQIDTAYVALNAKLVVNGTQNSEFESSFVQIDKLYDTDVYYYYAIASVPEYVSTSIKYAINTADLKGFLKGDSVKLVLTALDTEIDKDKALQISGYDEMFADAFNLSLYHNGNLVDYQLVGGIEIIMNLPVGYYEREVSVLKMDDYTKLNSSAPYHEDGFSKVKYTIQGGGNYVFVVKGSVVKTSEKKVETEKTLDVFGKDMPLSAFLGIVLGVGGSGIIITVLYIVIKKKGGKKR